MPRAAPGWRPRSSSCWNRSRPAQPPRRHTRARPRPSLSYDSRNAPTASTADSTAPGRPVPPPGASALARKLARELRDGIARLQRREQDPVLLERVGDRVALAGRGPLGAADVSEMKLLGEDLHQPR